MGLDIYIKNLEYFGSIGTYSTFNRLRYALAREEGLEGEVPERVSDARVWAAKSVLAPLLAPLITHPDFVGELNAEECEEILPRLFEIQKKWRSQKHELLKALTIVIDACKHEDKDGAEGLVLA